MVEIRSKPPLRPPMDGAQPWLLALLTQRGRGAGFNSRDSDACGPGEDSVATYAAVQGVMAAIEGMLNERLPSVLSAPPVNGSVQLVGSQAFKTGLPNNTLALWLYRIGIDPTVPGGYVRARPGSSDPRKPEVPVMLHFLMIAVGDSAASENNLMGWGFQQLAVTPIIGADRLSAQGLDWDDSDEVQVATEELTREELMRIWDTLPMKYSLTVPYVARGLRLELQPDLLQYPPVTDRITGFGKLR